MATHAINVRLRLLNQENVSQELQYLKLKDKKE